uniref:Uncharacterized protein n=1 Tax=Octopus bimaculoides TaxID=37653 RepID=A0A0L8GAY0_OCTBM
MSTSIEAPTDSCKREFSSSEAYRHTYIHGSECVSPPRHIVKRKHNTTPPGVETLVNLAPS